METTTAAARTGPARSSWWPWVSLTVGVIAVSGAAILIRYADDAEPFAISFWRCALGAAALAPFAGAPLRRLDTRQLRLPAAAGLFLALHFATWITSLELTTVAASVLLVTSSPVFVALAARYLLKERLSTAGWIGVALTFVGTALVAGGDLSGSSFNGNMLAVIGAITVSGYVLAGQVARRDLGNLEYNVVTYAAAGILLAVVCIVAGSPLWGYGAQTWIAIAGLVIGPQLLGHTVLNFVLKDLDATTVSVAVMAEPIVASLLALVLFSEVPPALIYPGGAAILAGIYLVSVVCKQAPEVVE
ncbi:MAG: DMT family transporter [Actinomycetota bacterium]